MKSVATLPFLLVLLGSGSATVSAQSSPVAPPQSFDRIGSLQLKPAKAAELSQLLKNGDYPGAEQLLLTEINQDSYSAHAATLLSFAAGVYFRAHDDRGAAIALSKADAIAPLEPTLRFSLAMALIRIGRPAEARRALVMLAVKEPSQALYPYWLGRLDYDAQQYDAAIQHFQKALAIDPNMARAYDNLGLCFYYLNRNDDAIQQYNRAIELDRDSAHPSAWPYLNLGVALEFTGKLDDAVKALQAGIRIDPKLAKAYCELGNIFERQGSLSNATKQFQQAALVDPAYPDPHVALARVYRKLGQTALSEHEVALYKALHQQQSAASQPLLKP